MPGVNDRDVLELQHRLEKISQAALEFLEQHRERLGPVREHQVRKIARGALARAPLTCPD